MSVPDSAPVHPARPRRFFGHPLFWTVVIACAAALPLSRALSTPPLPALPDLGVLPAFALTNQAGAPFGTDQLRGKVWVANFIFTRCPTICPGFTRTMHGVQERGRGLGDKLHLVSFSVDPEHDTPEVLRAYATKYEADPRVWSFLTGSPEAVRTAVVDGLKTLMSREGPADDVNGILHGSHFVLVDDRLHVRGYYASDDPEAVDRLVRDMGRLARGP